MKIYEEALNSFDKLPQAQFDTKTQTNLLRTFGVRLGLYDAVDLLKPKDVTAFAIKK